MNKQDFDSEVKRDEKEKRKCFKCEGTFYKDERNEIELSDYPVSEYDRIVSSGESNTDLRIYLCDSCFSEWLRSQGFGKCNCGKLSKSTLFEERCPDCEETNS